MFIKQWRYEKPAFYLHSYPREDSHTSESDIGRALNDKLLINPKEQILIKNFHERKTFKHHFTPYSNKLCGTNLK